MKSTWSIGCPAHLVPTAPLDRGGQRRRRTRRRAASARRSISSVANRHVRNWPSAVSRTRSQSPQNGLVTRRDHADRRRARRGSASARPAPRHAPASARAGSTASMAATISSWPTTWRVGPAPVGVERHELDEADLDAPLAAERGEVDDLVVVDAALHDGVDLDRVEPGLLRGVDAVEHLVAARRAGSSRRSARRRSESRLMLTRPQAGGAQVVGDEAAAWRRWWSSPGRLRPVGRAAARPACSTSTGRWARTVGSPPVRRMPSTPKRSTNSRASRSISSKSAARSRGSQRHALLRHAVGAAEVAAVGDRDPQVAHGAPEGIDEIRAIDVQATRRDRPATRSGDDLDVAAGAMPSPSGTTARRVGGGGGRQLVASLGADGAHVVRPSSLEAGRGRARGGSCRRARRGRPSSATATTWGGRAAVWPIIWRSAGRANSSKLTIELTPGCRAGRTPAPRAPNAKAGRATRRAAGLRCGARRCPSSASPATRCRRWSRSSCSPARRCAR